MKTIKLNKVDFDTKARLKTKARHSDITGEIVNCDAVMEHEGRPVVIYKKLDEEITKAMRWAVGTIKYSTSTRTGGLVSTSRIFGYSPRVALRNDFCSVTSLAKEFPKQHYFICKYAEEVARVYKEFMPHLYEKHCKEVESLVLPCWRLPNSPFTSGIINKDNHLAYHYDSGNFKDVASNMVSFKRNCKGGELLLPEFNTGLGCGDGYLSIFDGQSLFHGVAPFEIGYGGYRYTTVYHSLKAMGNCMTTEEEIARFRKRRIEIERKRRAGKPNKPLTKGEN